MITVHHVPRSLSRDIPFFNKEELASWARLHRNQFTHVAIVDTWNLEEAWELTNSIDHHWSQNDKVQMLVTETRSSSVGDIFAVEGLQGFVVSSIGFIRL